MASKKKVARKPAKRRTSKATSRTAGKNREHDCTPPDICEFLDSLSDWLRNDFIEEYRRLRTAVCNLDLQVFNGTGTMANRLCTGGASGEPTQPPDPPVW